MMTPAQREEAEALLWRYTHRDYKGTCEGRRSVLVLDESGATVVAPIDTMTDWQIARRLLRMGVSVPR